MIATNVLTNNAHEIVYLDAAVELYRYGETHTEVIDEKMYDMNSIYF